jgi:hypothetical protein
MWMAFCSGSYLKSPDRVIPIPGGEIKSRIDAFAYVDKTKTFNDGLGLPEAIQLFTSRDAFTRSRTNNPIPRTPEANRLGASSDLGVEDGLLALDHEVSAATNILGWVIPTKFTMTEYGKNRVGDWSRAVAVSGEVVSVRPVAAVRDQPFHGEIYHFTDYRFRDGQKFGGARNYSTTNAIAPPLQDHDQLCP